MTYPRLAAPLLLVCLLAGCGGAAGAAAQPKDVAVKTTTVNLPPSYIFDPVAIQVPVGSTVTWTNNDHFTHSVLITGTSDVHTMRPGQKTTITFSKAGQYDYVCTYHTQNMKGRVTVTG